nr:MAG TPA: hypothetical protein [Caudoviricetes sp.]
MKSAICSLILSKPVTVTCCYGLPVTPITTVISTDFGFCYGCYGFFSR